MVVLINFENLGFYNRDSSALVTCKVKIQSSKGNPDPPAVFLEDTTLPETNIAHENPHVSL